MPDVYHDSFLKMLLLMVPYLQELVLVGGWVPYVYHRYLSQHPQDEPLRTKDADWATRGRLTATDAQRPSLDKILREAGFLVRQIEGVVSHKPPYVTIYDVVRPDFQIQLNFLTMRGRGEEVLVKEIQPPIGAQAVRYLDVLLENKRFVTIRDALQDGTPVTLNLWIPTPAGFIFQKGLVLKERESVKQAKDLYYIYDFLAQRPEYLDEIVAGIQTIRDQYRKRYQKFSHNLHEFVARLEDPGIGMILSQHPLDEEPDQARQHIWTTLARFLRRLEE